MEVGPSHLLFKVLSSGDPYILKSRSRRCRRFGSGLVASVEREDAHLSQTPERLLGGTLKAGGERVCPCSHSSIETELRPRGPAQSCPHRRHRVCGTTLWRDSPWRSGLACGVGRLHGTVGRVLARPSSSRERRGGGRVTSLPDPGASSGPSSKNTGAVRLSPSSS